jgi:1,4-alpha-glucan branching enzyme
LRKSPEGNPIAVVANFTPVPRENYRVPLPKAGIWREIINTDAKIYGGSGKGNRGEVQAREASGGINAEMILPPLATIMLEYVPEDEEG